MKQSIFILSGGNLTFDPKEAELFSDYPHICWSLPFVPPRPSPARKGSAAAAGFGCAPTMRCFAGSDREKSTRTLVRAVARKVRDGSITKRHERIEPKPEPADRRKIYDLRAQIARLKERIRDLERSGSETAASFLHLREEVAAERRVIRGEINALVQVLTSEASRADTFEASLRRERSLRTVGAVLVGAGAALGVAVALLDIGKPLKTVGWGTAGALLVAGLGMLAWPADDR